MMTRILWNGVWLATGWGALGWTSAEAQLPDPPAYVTIVTGAGATRMRADGSLSLDGRSFSSRDNGIRLGDSVATASGAAATMIMPALDTAAYIAPDARLTLERGPRSYGDEAFVLRVVQGEVSISQKAATPRFVVAAGTGATAGLVTIRSGTVVVQTDGNVATFSVSGGSAEFASGPVPDVLPDKLTDARRLTAGQSVSTSAPIAPAPYKAADVASVSKSMKQSAYAFGVERSTAWVKRAERGDFTPVPAGGGRGGELVTASLTPTLAFDQPQQLTTVAAPTSVSAVAVRTIVSPAQSLLESGVPGSVIAGERFRRSRIIGNPGTGGIRVNPSVEQLIRIAGQ